MRRLLFNIIGLLMILTVLATVIWLIARSIKRAEDPAKLLFKWILTVIFTGALLWFAAILGFTEAGAWIVPPTCAVYGIAMAFIWAPSIGAIVAKPLTAMLDGGDTELEPQPLHSIAISRRKLGKNHKEVK